MTDLGRALESQRSAPTLSSLNKDVLLTIYCLLTAKEHLAVISTCRHLFHTGLSALLARPYSLTGLKLDTFHDFLLPFAPASFLSLQNLSFESRSTIFEIDTINDILGRATNLQALSMTFDNYLHQANGIEETIASLPKLRDLKLIDQNRGLSRSIVKRIQAPLVRLRLQLYDDEPLLPLLSNFCHTLGEVYLDLRRSSFTEVPFSCPRVTRLTLRSCSEVLLPILVHVFPNVEVLSVDSGSSASRVGNLQAINTAFEAHTRWRSLASLDADSVFINNMDLRGDVDSVVLHSVVSREIDRDNARSLQSLRPRHLQFRCWDPAASLRTALSVGMERLDRLDLLVEESGMGRSTTMVSTVIHSERNGIC